MATNKHAAIRYNILDKCFSNYNRKYTFDDLLEVCKDAIYLEYGDDSGISTRTLRDDIRFMKSEEGFSAPIVTRKDGGKPYYTYEDKEFTIKKQKLSSAEIEQLKNTLVTLSRFKGLPQFEWMNEVVARLEGEFKIKNDVAEIVGFEQNPYLKGLEHFDKLFRAISNKIVLKITYHPSFRDAEELIFHPYYLKQYNNRWFLFGLCDGRIMNMALDRIECFSETNYGYINNEDINFNEYFDDVVGVTVPYNSKIETIKLKVDKNRYNYIASKPLHQTQKVKERGDDYVVIELNLIPNYEFETLILGFADSIEVIEPIELKYDIQKRAKAILEKNI
ncbi:MAG: helix-turn-helix transcriptional regulator [Bacteroidales bacterium]